MAGTLNWICALLLLTVCSSCVTGGRARTDRLEAQLRVQEDQILQLNHQLTTLRSDLDAARHESTRLRDQLAQNGQTTFSPEHMKSEFRATGIQFNSYLTSGIDRDGLPGDEMLSVMLYPHDDKGGLIKLAGEVDLQVLDLSAPENEQELGRWTFSPAQTRKAWHTGFLAAGFLFELPWQRPPHGNQLTLHAEFRTADGRQFQQTQQIAIQVAAETQLPIQQEVPPEDLVPPADGLDLPAANAIETSDRYREWELPQIR